MSILRNELRPQILGDWQGTRLPLPLRSAIGGDGANRDSTIKTSNRSDLKTRCEQINISLSRTKALPLSLLHPASEPISLVSIGWKA